MITTEVDSEDNRSFLTDDSLKYLNVSHFSITSNGLSIEEEAIKNPLGVLPYQFEPKFDGPENQIGWGVNAVR